MSDPDLDELVRSNIREVLAAVDQQQPAEGTGTSALPVQEHLDDSRCALMPVIASCHVRRKPYKRLGITCPCCRAQSGVAATCNDGMLDPKLLEVPQSSEATIRLLRVRLKSVEEQLGMAMILNQGQLQELQGPARHCGNTICMDARQYTDGCLQIQTPATPDIVDC